MYVFDLLMIFLQKRSDHPIEVQTKSSEKNVVSTNTMFKNPESKEVKVVLSTHASRVNAKES